MGANEVCIRRKGGKAQTVKLFQDEDLSWQPPLPTPRISSGGEKRRFRIIWVKVETLGLLVDGLLDMEVSLAMANGGNRWQGYQKALRNKPNR